jgi:uncharacterized membrane protein YqjE
MPTAAPASVGFVQAFRTLGDGLLATVQDRVALFSVEVHEEKLRLVRTFIWISAAMFTAMMALICGSMALVYVFWESARLSVLGSLTCVYAIALGVLVLTLRRFLSRQPSPFAATLQAMNDDRACILDAS